MQQGKQVSFTAVSANVSLVAFVDTTVLCPCTAFITTVSLIALT
jgi:hypothetical protein